MIEKTLYEPSIKLKANPMMIANFKVKNDVILESNLKTKMEDNDKTANNIVSYFSQLGVTQQFKKMFIETLKSDESFLTKLQQIIESENNPNDEVVWKRIMESNSDLLSGEMKEILFKKFKEKLQEICQKNSTLE